MFNNINLYKLNNKISCEIVSYDDFTMLYGLFYKGVNDECEFIMSISYDVKILYEFRNNYLDNEEIKNSWIGTVDLLLISKISLFKEIILMLKCNNNIQKKYVMNKVDLIDNKQSYKLFCVELFNNNLTQNSYTKQHLIVIDSKKIYGKNFDNLVKCFKGNMFKNEIILDKFYPESIKMNNYLN